MTQFLLFLYIVRDLTLVCIQEVIQTTSFMGEVLDVLDQAFS